MSKPMLSLPMNTGFDPVDFDLANDGLEVTESQQGVSLFSVSTFHQKRSPSKLFRRAAKVPCRRINIKQYKFGSVPQLEGLNRQLAATRDIRQVAKF